MTTSTLGRIYLPSSPGTPVGKFSFIVDRDHGRSVVIGTPVAADTDEGTIIGTVSDLTTVGSDRDPLQADFENSTTEYQKVAAREDVMVAEVQVFHSPAMRPIRSGSVRPATAEEIGIASGLDRIEWPIPAGAMELADGSYAPICLDGHTLLGPESAHLAISGLSGMAAKTSYAGFLLRSAIHAGSPEQDSVGAIIFNVKGQDLVNLDETPVGTKYALTDDDYEMYEALGVPATPFEDVTVYAPSLPGGTGTRSTKATAEPLRWDLPMIWPYLRFFFPGLMENDNMSALLGDFEALLLRNERAADRIDTFAKLEAWFDRELAEAEEKEISTAWRSHHVATLRRARKLLMSLPERCGGLLTRERAKPSDDIPIAGWRHGQIVVVDIAGLDTIVQSAVIARTGRRLLDSAEGQELGLDHLILFADELNLFAPASGGDGSVKQVLRKIAATGRYAGLSLWGAGQFLSQVDPQIVGNSATTAMGIVSETELDSGVYGRLPAGQRETIVTLPKGSMALKAYNLRGQVIVKFPRPAWATGKDTSRPAQKVKPMPAALRVSPKTFERLTEGLTDADVERIVARADNPTQAIKELERKRHPDMTKVSVEGPSTYNVDDPFDLD